MENITKTYAPADLCDSEIDAVQGGYKLTNVMISSVIAPRDSASGLPTGKRQSFVADSFSFGVERE